jgi:hypothetical protein
MAVHLRHHAELEPHGLRRAKVTFDQALVNRFGARVVAARFAHVSLSHRPRFRKIAKQVLRSDGGKRVLGLLEPIQPLEGDPGVITGVRRNLG